MVIFIGEEPSLLYSIDEIRTLNDSYPFIYTEKISRDKFYEGLKKHLL